MTASPLPLLPLLLSGVPLSLRRMLLQEGVPTIDYLPGTRSGTFVLYDSYVRPAPINIRPEQRLIDVHELRRREVSDPFIAADNLKTLRTFWSVGPWEVSEETAAVDKRFVRERVLARLRRMIIEAGGVWCRLSPYPYPFRTAANFRFDHDAYDAGDFAAVCRAIRGHEGMTTHFVCGATHEHCLDALARLRGLDVGSHGYYHHTYCTFAENLRNISRGIDILQREGIAAQGFAAPHGRYNPGLAKALAALGVTYSSEFAAGYDDLPWEPSESQVTQIPIHPICLGIVFEAAAHSGTSFNKAVLAATTAEYFATVAAEKHAAGEPIFLYGHPDGRVGRYPQLLQRVFAAIDALPGVWQVSQSEFHRWWRQRSECTLVISAIEGSYKLQAERLPRDYPCAMEWVRDDGIASVPLHAGTSIVRPKLLHFVTRPKTTLSRPTRTEPIRGFKQRLRRYLDWEYETPMHEIDASQWRGWVKRRLRMLKGPRPNQPIHRGFRTAGAAT